MNPIESKEKYRVMDKKEVFQCEECGLHYNDETITQQCAAFCKENSACSIEITQNSLESSKKLDN